MVHLKLLHSLFSIVALIGACDASDMFDTRRDVVIESLLKANSEDKSNGDGVPTFVTISNGEIQGILNSKNNQRRFLGIPYANPPIDELRWQSPQPKSDWDGTLNATRFGNTCMQV
jgi:hypothetical protein